MRPSIYTLLLLVLLLYKTLIAAPQLDPIENKIYHYTTKEALNYDSVQTLSLVKSATYITFAFFNKEISPFEVAFITINLNRAIKKTPYKSELRRINQNNYEQKVPELQKKLKNKRNKKVWISTLSGLWLGYLVASNKISEKNQSILSQVSSDLISTGVINLIHKTPDERFIENLMKENNKNKNT